MTRYCCALCRGPKLNPFSKVASFAFVNAICWLRTNRTGTRAQLHGLCARIALIQDGKTSLGKSIAKATEPGGVGDGGGGLSSSIQGRVLSHWVLVRREWRLIIRFKKNQTVLIVKRF